MDTLSAWRRALRDPSLHDLPYKIETNTYGQLVMSPQKPRHGYLQSRLVELLLERMARPGRRAVEFPVETSRGVKVPDVVWISEARWEEIPERIDASPIAPDICIEVLSASNTPAEIDDKRRLYFECVAAEVWTCDESGRLRFFDRTGERPASELVASFPAEIG